MTYKEKIEQGRIFEFLIGINDEFELVCINIPSKGQLPSNEAYALAQSEESRNNVMRQYSSRPLERFALVSTPFLQKGGKSGF